MRSDEESEAEACLKSAEVPNKLIEYVFTLYEGNTDKRVFMSKYACRVQPSGYAT